MLTDNTWIIIANASRDIAWMLSYLSHKHIIVCDGIYNHLKDHLHKQTIVLGDFDSIEHVEKHFIHTPDQNKTDLQKAIEHADQQQAAHIIILNALQNDFSHSLHNVRLLKRFYNPQRTITMLHPFKESHSAEDLAIDQIQYVENCQLTLTGAKGDLISFFGFPRCTISSEGLAWELDHTLLDFDTLDSSRNRFLQPNVILHIHQDCLIISPQSIIIDQL